MSTSDKTLTLTIWERVLLSGIVGNAKAGESTIAYLRKSTKILDVLALTDEEREESGYHVNLETGATTWAKSIMRAFDFSAEDFAFLKGRVLAFDNWPSCSMTNNSISLAELFENA